MERFERDSGVNKDNKEPKAHSHVYMYKYALSQARRNKFTQNTATLGMDFCLAARGCSRTNNKHEKPNRDYVWMCAKTLSLAQGVKI